MKRNLFISLLVAAVLASISFGTFLTNSLAWAHRHSNLAFEQETLPEPAVDGSKNPNQVHDLVAQEILLRQLSTGDEGEDKDWKIRNSYLKWAGFDDVQSAALKFAAADFKQRIAALDQQVASIKSEKWPKPDKATMDQLANIQRLKETLVREIIGNLFQQLTYHNPDSVKTHLHARVKFNTKGFIPGLSLAAPPQKISWVERMLREPFVATAYASQYGGSSCEGLQYITSSTWVDYSADAVFTSAVVTYDYNSCGHGYTLSTTLSHGGASATGSNYVSMGLDPGGSSPRLDGFFGSSSTSYSYCFHSGTTHPTGGSGSSTTVSPTVQLISLSAAPNDVADNGTTTLIAIAKSSENISSGSVNIVFDKTGYNPGAVALATVPATVQANFGGGEARATHSVTGGGVKKGPVKFDAGIQSAPPGSVVTGGKQEVEVCFGPKKDGACPITP